MGRNVDKKLEEMILQSYMMVYMLGGNFTADSPSQVRQLLQLFKAKVANWPDTLVWGHQMEQNFLETHNQTSLSFNSSTEIVQNLSNTFGVVNDVDCARMKQE